MNIKQIFHKSKVFGSLFAIILTISTSLRAPDYRVMAQSAATHADQNVSPARTAVFTPPSFCPDPALAPITPELFMDDMESGSAKWTFAAIGSYINDWSIVTEPVSSPTHALNGPDEGVKNDSYAAMSADVTLEAGAPSYLYFYHKYVFDGYNATEGYDGGVVEYSTDHGATWKTDIETYFSAGQNYNATIKLNYQNPIEGRRAFSLSSDGVVATRYDLTPLAGQSVRFRWRTASDYNNVGTFAGWYVDDVKIYTCSTQVNSITRVNPSPTNLGTVNFTVTFSRSVTGVDMTGPTFDDFSLTTTGLSGAAVSSVSGSGATYTVGVNTGTGNGTVRLNVVTGGAIVDTFGKPLVKGFTTGEVYSILKAAIFADVPLSYWANIFIERMYIWNITGGCSSVPLMYCPESFVTRAQMAVFLLRGIHGSSYAPPAASGTIFDDVPASYWAAAWVERLAAEGITSGCGTRAFCPDTIVSRAQMAVFLLRSEHGASYTPPAAVGVFSDVPPSYWAVSWIERLAAEGITSGCGTGTYCPENLVTRAQMAVFLVRAFNLP